MMQRVVACALVIALACVSGVYANDPQYLKARMPSEVLTRFWGRPISIDAHILLPDSYYKEKQRRYPVFYWIQGFDQTGEISMDEELAWQRPMRRLAREFIVIFLDGMFNDGHQEFADSANNGPWGTALTTEFIPQIDAHFRTIADPAARFVGGHSSGGWSALWLQVNYPDLFGAEWSIAPDPVDFRYFLGSDLTRGTPQNFYKDSVGHEYHMLYETVRSFANGPGWKARQMESFERVFSPRGRDGTPERLFDRNTGAIDAAVAQYWVAHYDIARILNDNWPALAPMLRGKLHIIVGTADDFYLDLPVRLLNDELQSLGSDAEIDFAPGAGHVTVFDWNGGLINYIVSEASSHATPRLSGKFSSPSLAPLELRQRPPAQVGIRARDSLRNPQARFEWTRLIFAQTSLLPRWWHYDRP